MTIQDMAAALAARDSGIERAVEHCESVKPEWAQSAYQYLMLFACRASQPFTGEDAREWAESCGFETASKRAWGGVVGGAKARGDIVKVGTKATKASNGSERATYVKGSK